MLRILEGTAPTESFAYIPALKIQNCLNTCANVMISPLQELYEIAFANHVGNKPFSPYSLRPRVKLPPNCRIGDVNVEPRSVLVLEEDDEAIDPLTFLSKVSKYCQIIHVPWVSPDSDVFDGFEASIAFN